MKATASEADRDTSAAGKQHQRTAFNRSDNILLGGHGNDDRNVNRCPRTRHRALQSMAEVPTPDQPKAARQSNSSMAIPTPPTLALTPSKAPRRSPR